ncbi:alpha/beta fold hydrolase [Nonomuraea sediminis]|uniref:alpha/beta fold hydrolase n=1 Tax=Nonomuraea sediminis TaxID=2835864 RepID=UPI001BDD88F9|nr:alpha/beta hydrolase [Nonomuraea sediminis]
MIRHPQGRLVDGLWLEEEGSGEPVLLLSGLGPAGSHVIFHPHFDALADTHRVLYLDLRGRGRSERPADLSQITFAGDVADVAAVLETIGPVHLYGFSYGGLLSQALALDHPHLVRSLTVANSLHSPEMWQLNHANLNREIANQLPEVWDRILELRAEGLRSTDAPMRAEFAKATPLIRFFDPAAAARLADEPGARNLELYPVFCGDDVDFVIGGQVPHIPDFRPRLKDLTMPFAVLAGRHDRALYPALQRDFQRHAPKAEFHLLERSGSFSHVEEPETVLALLREFWR